MYTLKDLSNYLCDKKLYTKNDVVLVTGSFATSCMMNGDFSRFNNGKSDIDIIIILEDKNSIKKFLNKDEWDLFINEKIQMLNFTSIYGIGRNQIHIKYISYKDFFRLVNFEKIEYKSWRQFPLSQYKSFEVFPTSNGKEDIMKYSETKSEDSSGYILKFLYYPFDKGVYRMSNIHSMILNSVLINEGCIALDCLKDFYIKVIEILSNLKSDIVRHLFKKSVESMNWTQEELDNYILLLKDKYKNKV